MKKHYIAGIIIFVLGIAFSTNVFAEGDVVRGKAKYKVCAACHGENAAGNDGIAPPLQANIHGI